MTSSEKEHIFSYSKYMYTFIYKLEWIPNVLISFENQNVVLWSQHFKLKTFLKNKNYHFSAYGCMR